MKNFLTGAVLLALLALAGCGSSSSGNEVSHTAFIVKADARCKADITREEALANGASELTENIQNGDPETKRKIEELGETERDLIGQRREDLAKLEAQPAPGADEEALAAFFAATESSYGSTLAWSRATEAHEAGKAHALAKQANAGEHEAEHLARQFGFKVCGAVYY